MSNSKMSEYDPTNINNNNEKTSENIDSIIKKVFKNNFGLKSQILLTSYQIRFIEFILNNMLYVLNSVYKKNYEQLRQTSLLLQAINSLT